MLWYSVRFYSAPEYPRSVFLVVKKDGYKLEICSDIENASTQRHTTHLPYVCTVESKYSLGYQEMPVMS